MTDASPWADGLPALLTAYRDGARTPAEVVEEVIERRAAGDPAVWITATPAAQLRARARVLADGPADLPLLGVPVAVKDNIDVAGLPTTAACPAHQRMPTRSATAVRLLEQAGAIVVGKTNMDQFATGLVGTRSPYGTPRNPAAPDHVPGGSSSGSGAAVAGGLVPLALGTDTAGSGRVPAALTGIVGAKPTRGLVSTDGVVPACRSLDTVSVFSGSVGDAALALSVLEAYDPEDPWARSPRDRSAPPHGLAERPVVGVPDPTTLAVLDPHAHAAYAVHLDRLRGLGCRMVEVDLSAFLEAALLLYEGPWVAERIAAFGDFVTAHPDAVDPVVRQVVDAGHGYSAVDAFRGADHLRRLRRRAEQVTEDVDLLALPSVPTVPTLQEVAADPLGPNARLGTFTNFVNLLDLAALAVPLDPRGDGLPAGVTLVGRACTDPWLRQLGARLLGEAPPPGELAPSAAGSVPLAVVGAHLQGEPLHHELVEAGARLRDRTTTAACYRLYALADALPSKPGLVRDESGAAIEVEVYDLPVAAFGAFVAAVPPPLAIGTLQLADGSAVPGFVCEPIGTRGATDITAHGGWRAWRAAAPVG